MILRMPLTLAIIPCLIVTVSGDRYAIPQRELEEAVCLHPGLKGRIEQAVRYRVLPAARPPAADHSSARSIRYAAAVHRRDQSRDSQTNTRPRTGNPWSRNTSWSCAKGSKRFGLLVDDVRGTEEIVVKPMNAAMKRVEIFTGATIMGDGRVALIANVAGIVQHARVSFEAELPDGGAALSRAPRKPIVSCCSSTARTNSSRCRSCRFAASSRSIRGRIEHVGDHEYVTIDGVATRILRLENVIAVSPCEPQRATHLVLPKFAREPTGILISRIVDSESMAVDLQAAPAKEPGILGTAVVRDRLTLFLDSHCLVEKFLGTARLAVALTAARQARILLVDDTPFFREAVGRYLTAAGHRRHFGRSRQRRHRQAIAGPVRPRCLRHRDAGHGWLDLRAARTRPRIPRTATGAIVPEQAGKRGQSQSLRVRRLRRETEPRPSDPDSRADAPGKTRTRDDNH